MTAKTVVATLVTLAAVAVGVGLLVRGPDAPGGDRKPPPEPPYARPALFSPTSFWNRRLPAGAPLDPASPS